MMKRNKLSKFIIYTTKIGNYLPFLLLNRTKIIYLDKRSKYIIKKLGCIIISNHTNLFDFPLFLMMFFRPIVRCLTAEVMSRTNKCLTWFLYKLGAIFVNRFNHDLSFTSQIEEALKEKHKILIFPEGRLPKDGEKELLPFNPFYIHLAKENNVPIILCATNGQYIKKKKNKLIIGESIDVNTYWNDENSPIDNLKNINKIIEVKIKKLYEESKK